MPKFVQLNGKWYNANYIVSIQVSEDNSYAYVGIEGYDKNFRVDNKQDLQTLSMLLKGDL